MALSMWEIGVLVLFSFSDLGTAYAFSKVSCITNL
uniref:Uncharacterized protein n=1 Tax=Arundo donax TaxID=35708 RepID=A0A0A8ZM15_ARUDO